MNRFRRSHLHRGITLLDALGGVIVASALLVLILSIVNSQNADQRNQIAAGHIQQVATAASRYLDDNYDTLQGALAAGPIYLQTSGSSIAALKAAGYLDPGFSDTNALGQGYKIVFMATAAGDIEGLLATDGGSGVSRGDLGAISRRLGADSAVIEGSTAKGALGGWTRDLAPYQSVVPIADKQIAVLFMSTKSGDVTNNSLYRTPVPGKPDANAMQTTLNMNGEDISGAMDIQAEGLVVGGGGLLPQKIAEIGEDCTLPGLIAQTSDGTPVYCNGKTAKFASLEGDPGTPGTGGVNLPPNTSPAFVIYKNTTKIPRIMSWYDGTYWQASYSLGGNCYWCGTYIISCKWTAKTQKSSCSAFPTCPGKNACGMGK